MADLAIPGDRAPDLVAPIGFEPAFTLTLEYGTRHLEQTPHGGRLFRKITGGAISGKIEGTVYPQGAGEYSLVRDDGVTDVNEHVLVRDRGGEWIYLRNIGYSRHDGYYRVTNWVDADVRGKHGWVLGLLFLGIAEPGEKDRLTIRFYEVL
jgi:hypothetical protein